MAQAHGHKRRVWIGLLVKDTLRQKNPCGLTDSRQALKNCEAENSTVLCAHEWFC